MRQGELSLDNLVFVGGNGVVAALDPTTGVELWRTPLPKSMWSMSFYVTLARSGDALYVGHGKMIHRLDALTGAVVWSRSVKGISTLPIVLTGRSAAVNEASLVAAMVQQQAAAAAAAG